MSRHCAQAAFSLIELLVVIGIVALVIALLLPVLSSARKTGQSMTCASNMRQLSLMVNTFTVDNKDAFPANRIFAAPGQHITWRAWLIRLGYIDLDAAWACPQGSPTAPRSELGRNILSSHCIDDIQTNYAYNGSAFWGTGGININKGTDKKQVNIYRPSKLIMLVETQGWWPDLGDWMLAQDYYAADGWGGYWHPNNTTNYAMADGSIKNAKAIDMLAPYTQYHNTYRPKPLTNLAGPDIMPDKTVVVLSDVFDVYR